ncbi:MAG: sulfatase [Chthonomonadaceae bacterium]|nr:sulfatase [Chthonomonadaceae bacterium]
MVASLLLAASWVPARPPNIVLLFVDDMGWMDLACQGSDFYETPNIDRLARQGVRFTNAYAAAPVCSPTRAAMLTGKTPARVGITDWIPGARYPHAKLAPPEFNQELPASETTIAEALKGRGYRTIHIGKWHLGGRGAWPTDHGFDVNIGGGVNGQPASYTYPFGWDDPKNYWRVRFLPDPGKPGQYLTDLLTDQAVSQIEENRDRPFFLYFPYYNVHAPYQAKPHVAKRFAAKAPGRLQKNPTYAAMVSAVDDSVGRILRTLDRLHLENDTLVVFTSDNGGVHNVSPQNPLRLGKGFLYEGGIREPLIVRWPGVTPEGQVANQMVTTVDFYPTFLQAAGVPIPGRLDGTSLLGTLRHPLPNTPERTLTWHYPHYHTAGRLPVSAIRQGRWKLLWFHEDQRVELYDLATDLGETKDLAKTMPERAEALLKTLKTSLAQQGAKFPTPNPDYDPEKPWRDGFSPNVDDGGTRIRD